MRALGPASANIHRTPELTGEAAYVRGFSIVVVVVALAAIAADLKCGSGIAHGCKARSHKAGPGVRRGQSRRGKGAHWHMPPGSAGQKSQQAVVTPYSSAVRLCHLRLPLTGTAAVAAGIADVAAGVSANLLACGAKGGTSGNSEGPCKNVL